MTTPHGTTRSTTTPGGPGGPGGSGGGTPAPGAGGRQAAARQAVERAARRALARDGRTVDRPVGDGTLPLAYVRTGPRGDAPPVVVVPGGPGLASVLPYAPLRAAATRRGLDVLMVEHRGVGLSRRDSTGRDLAPEAVTVAAVVDDLAAVLDDAGVERAVLLGASYGSYVAQAFGARHPDRVAGMVLDSPVLAPVDDLAASRSSARATAPSTPTTRRPCSPRTRWRPVRRTACPPSRPGSPHSDDVGRRGASDGTHRGRPGDHAPPLTPGPGCAGRSSRRRRARPGPRR